MTSYSRRTHSESAVALDQIRTPAWLPDSPCSNRCTRLSPARSSHWSRKTLWPCCRSTSYRFSTHGRFTDRYDRKTFHCSPPNNGRGGGASLDHSLGKFPADVLIGRFYFPPVKAALWARSGPAPTL